MILCFPTIMLATRGSEDYGIIMAFMAMVYCMPAGLMLLGFVIYSITKLKTREKLKPNQGKTVYVISIIAIILSIFIPIAWMYSANWDRMMVKLMLADFVPVILLATTSLLLSIYVKKKSAKITF